MMIRDEEDILAEVLHNHSVFCSDILVLDGTTDPRAQSISEKICRQSPLVRAYWRDTDTGYEIPLRDGARRFLLEQSRRLFGTNNWHAVLHGDELWGMDPRPILAQDRRPVALRTKLFHFFPHVTDRATWFFEPGKTSIEKLATWYMEPGIPEDRLFFDTGDKSYDEHRHSRTVPPGLDVLDSDLIIKQYNYRSPHQAHLRAVSRAANRWQHNHYQHLIAGEADFFVDTLAWKGATWAELVPPGEGEAVNISSHPLPTLRPNQKSDHPSASLLQSGRA